MKQLNTVASTSSSSRYRAYLYSVQRYLYIDSISLIKTRAKQKHAQVCKVKVNFEHGRMCYAYVRARGSVEEGGGSTLCGTYPQQDLLLCSATPSSCPATAAAAGRLSQTKFGIFACWRCFALFSLSLSVCRSLGVSLVEYIYGFLFSKNVYFPVMQIEHFRIDSRKKTEMKFRCVSFQRIFQTIHGMLQIVCVCVPYRIVFNIVCVIATLNERSWCCNKSKVGTVE